MNDAAFLCEVCAARDGLGLAAVEALGHRLRRNLNDRGDGHNDPLRRIAARATG